MPRRNRLDRRRSPKAFTLPIFLCLLLLVALSGCKAVRQPNTVVGGGGFASLSRSSASDAQERSAGGVAVIGTYADVNRDDITTYADGRGALGGGGGGFAGLLELQGEVGPAFGDDEHRFGLRAGAGALFQGQADSATYRIQLPTVFAGWIYHASSAQSPHHMELGLRSSLNLFTRERHDFGAFNHGLSLDVGVGLLAMTASRGPLGVSRGMHLQAEYLYTVDTTPIHTLHVRGCIGALAMFCLDARHDRVQAQDETVGVSTIQLYFMVGLISGSSLRRAP